MEAQNMSEEKGLQPDTMQEPAPAEEEAPEAAEASPGWPDWARAYWEFIFNGRYSFDDFAVSAVGLLDLNQDETPELVLYHYSSGSLGGWYSFYYYNGSEAVPVFNQEGEAVVCGTGLYLYYYPESRKLMMYHMMSIILGNYQGSYRICEGSRGDRWGAVGKKYHTGRPASGAYNGNRSGCKEGSW